MLTFLVYGEIINEVSIFFSTKHLKHLATGVLLSKYTFRVLGPNLGIDFERLFKNITQRIIVY